MNSSCAICLVTDANYMLPTVVAAIQARRAVDVKGAEVFILAIGLPAQKAAEYNDLCRDQNVHLIEVTRDIFGGSEGNSFVDAFFSGSKFTFGALGRFFLDQIIDPAFDQLLYIDGDIAVRGSLNPLIEVKLEPRTFLAAPDPNVFLLGGNGRQIGQTRQYMANLGLSKDEYSGYFNSGVLRISRDGWRDIGLTAWEFLRSNPEKCVRHDQSALNAVARGARRPLSLRWNYPPFYNYYGLADLIEPRVVHFMSHPKPWNGAFPPWTNADHQPYLDFVARYPSLKQDLNVFSGSSRLKYILWQNFKRLEEASQPSRRAEVRKRVAQYQSQVLV